MSAATTTTGVKTESPRHKPKLGDIIFVSMENWDDVWRRNQFLCSGFAQRNPSSKLLFVGLSRDVSHQVRVGNLSELKAQATYAIPGLPGITATRPLKLLPNTLTWGRLFNEMMARRHIERVARQIGIANPILWLNPHYAVHMAGRMNERVVVYDITDDWTELTQSKRETALTIAQDRELCQRADVTIVCSQRLFDLKQGLSNNIRLIPNGVDAEHYRRVLDGSGPLPDKSLHWPRPVLGYAGSLHSDRIDLNLIESLSKQLQQGCIVLLGPNFLSATEKERLGKLNNVILTGPVPYKVIPDYIRAFDVCMTPHVVSPFTESLNPIKLWEYFAAGKPIISTPVAGFRDYPELVYLESNAEGFIRALKASLLEDGSKAEARRSEARKHSWTSRIEAVEDAIGSTANAS